MLTTEQIAYVASAANDALRDVTGQKRRPIFLHPDNIERTIRGVTNTQMAPETTPEQSHEKWMADYLKTHKAEEHPCCVPYSQLPVEDKLKDELFLAIVRALSR